MPTKMKSYIESKISKIEETSNAKGYLSRLANGDADIRRLWREELENDNAHWRKINSNDDVIDLINRFDGQVQFVENHVPFGNGNIIDGYNMALAEYRAVQGLRKMAQFIDPSLCNPTKFTPISEEEIDKLFERMITIINRKNQQDFLRAIQD